MIIKNGRGYELVKEMPNTSEDFFNRSEITIVSKKMEKTFYVLYVRYFEDKFREQNPLLFEGSDLSIKDVMALICIIQNEALLERKRLYLNTEEEFLMYLQGIDLRAAIELIPEMNRNQTMKWSEVVQKLKTPIHKK
ncbi:hypothetical protein RFW18_12365 [Metabacillus idriensis]|uniref:hypothetical protein n=1 Tax=Metabacillus idriensis TaxID=324768 RepID=UPI0028133D54|nr:hypothetical protein [Metabacillus idriensis]MDR0138540.1 hypothetical protein [Metabacillus idriensis]